MVTGHAMVDRAGTTGRWDCARYMHNPFTASHSAFSCAALRGGSRGVRN